MELVPQQTQPTIGHTANLHLVASLLHMTNPSEWNDTTLRQHSVFENPPNQPTACSTYRPDSVSVYKSTRPNWPSVASRSRNYPAPENRGDECDGCFKVRLGNQ